MTKSAAKASLVLAFGVFAASASYAAPPSEGGQAGIVLVAPSIGQQQMATAETAKAGKVVVTMAGKSGRESYSGPLLWQLLEQANAIPPKPRDQVADIVLVTGADGYSVALALGEISPAFEAKQVILADRNGDAALPDGHFRLVVPGDARGGRSVRDVVRIEVRPESVHP